MHSQILVPFLLLCNVVWGFDLNQNLGAASVYLSRSGLQLPLNPVLWATIESGERMLVALKTKNINDKDEVNEKNVFFVNRRGVIPLTLGAVGKWDVEQIDGEASLNRVANASGIEKINYKSDIKFVEGKIKSFHLDFLPAAYWNEQDRASLSEIIHQIGVAPLLNAIVDKESTELNAWIRELIFSAPFKAKGRKFNYIRSFLVDPMVKYQVKLGELSSKALYFFGHDLYGSYGEDWIAMMMDLDEAGLKVAKWYCDSIRIDKNMSTLEWIFLESTTFQEFSGSLRKSIVNGETTDEKIGAEERFFSVANKLLGDKPTQRVTAHKISKYLKDVVRKERDDVGVLKFISSIKKPLDISGLKWDFASWTTGKACELVGGLVKDPEYLELFMTCHLLGKLVPSSGDMTKPGFGDNQEEWDLMAVVMQQVVEDSKDKKSIRKMNLVYWKYAPHFSLLPLLTMIGTNPRSLQLPEELLTQLAINQGNSSALVAPLIAQAHRLKPNFLKTVEEAQKSKGVKMLIKQAFLDPAWENLHLPILKSFVEETEFNAMIVLLKRGVKESELVKVDKKVIEVTCKHVISGLFDLQDIDLLNGLLETHGKKLSVPLLKKLLTTVLYRDAMRQEGQVIDPMALRRFSSAIHESVRFLETLPSLKLAADLDDEESPSIDAGSNEITLAIVGEDFNEQFDSDFLFFLPGEANPTGGSVNGISLRETIENLVWQTNGNYVPAYTPLLMMISYYYPTDQVYSSDLLNTMRWVISRLDTPQALTLLHRSQIRDEVSPIILARLVELDFLVPPVADSLLAKPAFRLNPFEAVLGLQYDVPGLQQLIVHEERKYPTFDLERLSTRLRANDDIPSKGMLKTMFKQDKDRLRFWDLKACHTEALLDRLFSISGVDQVRFKEAKSLTNGNLMLAFKLVQLVKAFNDQIPMRLLLDILLEQAESISKAAEFVKNVLLVARQHIQ